MAKLLFKGSALNTVKDLAQNIKYTLGKSTLTKTNVQDAIDEVDSKVEANKTNINSNHTWKIATYVTGSTKTTFSLPSTATELLVISRTPYYSFTNIVPIYQFDNYGNSINLYNAYNGVQQAIAVAISKTYVQILSANQNGSSNVSSAQVFVYYR